MFRFRYRPYRHGVRTYVVFTASDSVRLSPPLVVIIRRSIERYVPILPVLLRIFFFFCFISHANPGDALTVITASVSSQDFIVSRRPNISRRRRRRVNRPIVVHQGMYAATSSGIFVPVLFTSLR